MTALARLRQFAFALAAHLPTPHAAALASPAVSGTHTPETLLAPTARALFERMSVDERAHSRRVYTDLHATAPNDTTLLTAALLHDIGKTNAPLHLWERTLPVLARIFVPAPMRRAWSAGAPTGWRRPFVVAAQHAAWGAELATTAGCAPEVVALIRAHQDPAPPPSDLSPFARRLRALQAADDRA